MDMRLEVVVLPVSDVDRARDFYQALGWRLDADFPVDEGFRVVQMTPPGSACSIAVGIGITKAAPGSAQGLHLVVPDIEAARAELAGRGVDVGDVQHFEAGGMVPGPDPERRDYGSYVFFSDPDGNSWAVQEVRRREPRA